MSNSKYKECQGCFSQCSVPDNLYSQCPCSKCIIKVTCRIACEDFTNIRKQATYYEATYKMNEVIVNEY